MDNSPGLFGSEMGDLADSVSVHFPLADFTTISPIEDGAPNSATYIIPPVPVVCCKAKDAVYAQSVTKPLSGRDTQPLETWPVLASKKAAVMLPD